MNRIPIRKNRTSNFCLESPYGSKPHSYVDIFSGSGFFTANRYEAPTIIKAKATATIKNKNIELYSSIFVKFLIVRFGSM